MQLTKFGHSCVLIDDGQTKILFDPGNWSESIPPDLKLDVLVVTHIHQDHLGLDKNLNVFQQAPKIFTNQEVANELAKNNLIAEAVTEGQTLEIGSTSLQVFGSEHAIIHPDFPKFQNNGYLINDKIFHPGDSFTVPPVSIETLLLPLSSPWAKISETLDHLFTIKPKNCFPIHDELLSEKGKNLYNNLGHMWAEKISANYIVPELGKVYEV